MGERAGQRSEGLRRPALEPGDTVVESGCGTGAMSRREELHPADFPAPN